MEEMETSSVISSSQESVEENYDWVTDKKFSSENKKDYLKYPLEDWRKIVFDPDLEISQIDSEVDYYENRVIKVLKNEVFTSFKFYENKSGITKFRLMKNYKVDRTELLKGFISPDFFIHKIDVNKFTELLENRKYMMKSFKKLKANTKYVSIIGEIKISHNSAIKDSKQRKDYITFIKKAKLFEEELILMYIYDQSYNLFKTDKEPKDTDEIFMILCYIPKLYLNDCYNAYNNIIDELKLNVKKIDMKIITTKKLTKKELIKQLNDSKKQLNDSKKKLNESRFGIIVLILIIGFLLKKIYN